MNNVNSFKGSYESIPDSRKIVLLMTFIKIYVDFLGECGFLKNDFNCLCLVFKNIIMEQNEVHLEDIKNENVSIFGKIS